MVLLQVMKFHGQTQKGGRILLKIEKKVTEDDIIGLIKSELSYNSVEIKKRGSKGLKWDNLRFADIS